MGRFPLVFALAALPALALAGAQPIGQRALSGSENRFIEIPGAAGEAGFRAVSPGKRIAFEASGLEMHLRGPRLGKAGGTASLRYAFAGGAKVAPQGVNPSPTVYHWLVGDRSQWRTGLKSYGALAYRGVWPGVDAVFAGDRGGFKYQFELAAGTDPATVAMLVEGADDVRVTEAGTLEWRIGGETVVDEAPLAFQPARSGHDTVAAAYRVEKVGANAWRIGFTLADFDKGRALIIDPAWTGYSGLVGGSAQDQVFAVARDASANTYACGVTASTQLPVTTSFTDRVGEDGFVVRFDAAGTATSVSYFGGNGYDACHSIAVDGSGRIYLAGATESTDFPTAGTDGTGRFRRTKATTDRDAFVMRLAATGATIDYAGFIGGTGIDQANAIALDSTGRAYVTGFSTCVGAAPCGTTFPALTGPRTTHGGDTLGTGGMDAFVARVAADGGTLEYAGFIGGDGGAEMGNAIAVDASFAAYVAGQTDSATGLATPGGFRTAINARTTDASDGFVAKVAADGASLVYFTLLTGTAPAAGAESGADRALALALESDGSVIVAGETDSLAFPANDSGTRAGAGPQSAGGGGMDGFVLRLNAAGTAIDAATYLGGSGHDSAEGVATDGTALYVTGTTTSGATFPVLAQNGLATTPPGGQDGFLVKIVRATPGALAYSGFLGTSATEALRAVAASIVGNYTILSLGGVTTTAGTTGLTNPSSGAYASAGASNGLVLRVDAFGPVASVTAQGGSGQSATILQAFATPLSVLVADNASQPLANVTVTFTAPGSGASATLYGATATTNASGIASVTATANGTAGGPYNVTASAGGFSATFALTNLRADQTISFGTAPAVAYLGTGTVTATATSGLAVTFSTASATCSVNATTGLVTGLAVGDCTIAANQGGNGNYNAAPQVTQTIAIAKANQTIAFGTAPTVAYNGTGTATATATSGLAVSYSTTSPACSVNATSGLVTGLAVGSCTIAADQGGNGSYNPAPQATQTFNVVKADQTIAFGVNPTVLVGGTGSVTATATSGLAVTFSTSSATCSVNATTGLVTGLSAGNCTIDANQGGNGNYNPAPAAQQTFPIGKVDQTIAFAAAPTVAVGGTGSVSATASSGLAVTYSTASATCTVNATSGLVTGVSAGDCTIAANQGGNGTYNPAPQATQTLAIQRANQSITFGVAPAITFGGTGTVSATASSGLAVSFSTASATCSVNASSGLVTALAAGDCVVAADQVGNANYNPAPQATQTIAIARANQSIAFGTAPTVAFGGTGTVSATATSGLAVAYSTVSATCSVNATTGLVTGLAVGNCTIDANQGGNGNYNPAPAAQQTFAIVKASQSITFGAAPAVQVGTTGTASATASSGLAVTYSTASASCSVNASTGVVTGIAAGNCTIAADQGGNGSYDPAPQATQTFAIGRGSQSITFAPLAARALADGPLTLSATASTGLAVTFTTLTPSVCSVAGTTLSPVAAGDCTVAADQSGNADYEPAPRITRGFALIDSSPGADTDADGVPDTIELQLARQPFVKDNDVFAAGAGGALLFVLQQYRDFLGREGDPAGVQAWTDLLLAGTVTREAVIDAIVRSIEFQDATAQVVGLYFAAFNRLPDPVGLAHNVRLLTTGVITLEAMAEYFTATAEFQATYGGLDNTQFMTRLYQVALGRAPDAGGLAAWVAALDAGTVSRAGVLLGFIDAAEFQQVVGNRVFVTMLYEGMLRRVPDAAGLAGWTSQLDGGLPRTAAITGFLYSTEYRARVLGP